MSSIQEKMEALRLQKAMYSGNTNASRKLPSATPSALSLSLQTKHPVLPKSTTEKPNSVSYQNEQVAIFNKSTQPTKALTGQSTSTISTVLQSSTSLTTAKASGAPPTAVTTAVQGLPNKTTTNTVVTSGPPKSSPIEIANKKNPKLIPNLDPLQSCYGTKTRVSQLKQDDADVGDAKLKGILSRPSSPCDTPTKKKRVTFDMSEMLPSSAPPPPITTPVPVRTAADLAHSTPSSSASTSSASTTTSTAVKGSGVSNGRPIRPSLSEQLSAITDKVSEVTADIKVKAGVLDPHARQGEAPLLTTPAKNFTVGHLQCRYPAPVTFFSDRFEYDFHHPFQHAEIHLTVYYRDMAAASLTSSPAPGKLIFRVPRHLVHFSADYDPSKHYVVLFLSSGNDLQFIKKNIMPKIIK